MVELGLSFALSAFVLEPVDALSMVESAGCHRLCVLYFGKLKQQTDNQPLSNYFNCCIGALIAAPKPQARDNKI